MIGVNICNEASTELSGWAKEELKRESTPSISDGIVCICTHNVADFVPAIFLRLATIPHFFGLDPTEFPDPTGLLKSTPGTSKLSDPDQTGMIWDYLVNRSVRLVRQGLCHHHGSLSHLPVPASLFEEQRDVLCRLAEWRQRYELEGRGSPTADDEFESSLHRRMECIVGQIWVACCLSGSEMRYDQHNADFEDLMRVSQQLIDLRTESGPAPKFIFEMGFTPFLYFVIINCRRLDLRLEALRHILLLSYNRENLFDTRSLYSIGMRIIELEHEIHLDPSWPEYPGAGSAPLPREELRIMTANLTDDFETRTDSNGQMSEYRKVFFLFEPEANGPGSMEWVKITTPSRTAKSPAHLGTGKAMLWPV